MMKRTRTAICRGMIGVMLAGLLGCEKTDVADNEKGPAEKAGAQIDHAAARAGEELNKVAEKAGEGLQRLGQKLQDEAQQAKQASQPQEQNEPLQDRTEQKKE